MNNADTLPCSICKHTPSAFVKERVPGSKGNNRNSFAQEYRLCLDCIRVCSQAGAIEKNIEPEKLKERIFIVRGKTRAWLINLRDNVWLERVPPK